MSLYAYSYCIQQGAHTIHHGVGFCLATSNDEAVGIGTRVARCALPSSDGWGTPDVVATEVPSGGLNRARTMDAGETNNAMAIAGDEKGGTSHA